MAKQISDAGDGLYGCLLLGWTTSNKKILVVYVTPCLNRQGVVPPHLAGNTGDHIVSLKRIGVSHGGFANTCFPEH
ncbi:MAG: hypothetical protein HQL87_18630 [Magnetococcales bacterium]|nr:hypothetical protein [Magnetococcales bacterium]